MSPRDFVLLEAQVRRSLVFRAIDRIAITWSAAWTHASISRRIGAFHGGLTSLAPDARVRAVAVFVAVFAAGQAAAQRIMPPQVAPAAPPAASLLVVASALAAAVAARRLCTAWQTSTLRRWLRLGA